jgi:hypothetical protein
MEFEFDDVIYRINVWHYLGLALSTLILVIVFLGDPASFLIHARYRQQHPVLTLEGTVSIGSHGYLLLADHSLFLVGAGFDGLMPRSQAEPFKANLQGAYLTCVLQKLDPHLDYAGRYQYHVYPFRGDCVAQERGVKFPVVGSLNAFEL